MAKRRSAAEYRDIFAQRGADQSLASLAREHGINRRTLAWWAWKLNRSQSARRQGAAEAPPEFAAQHATPGLLPVVLDCAPSPEASPPDFEISIPGSFTLRVPPRFDPDALRLLLSVMRAAC